MKKQVMTLALAVAAASLSSVAMADTAPANTMTANPAPTASSNANGGWKNFSKTNLYVGGAIGPAWISSNDSDGGSTSGFGWNAHVGYNFGQFAPTQLVNWSAEFGYNNFTTPLVGLFYKDSEYAFDFAGKASYTIVNNVSVFGKAGFAIEHSGWSQNLGVLGSVGDSHTGLVGFFGVGGEYQFLPQWSATAEFDTTAFGGSNLPMMYMLGFGANYNF
jgi:hypothetical protein